MLSPASLHPGTTRRNSSVIELSAFVGDFDGGLNPEQLANHLRGHGIAHVIHSTFNSTAGHLKFRVWIPLSRPVPAQAWPAVWIELNRALALGKSDPATKAASQAFYLPAHPSGAEPFLIVGPGLAYVPDLPTRTETPPPLNLPTLAVGHENLREIAPADVLRAAARLARSDPDLGEALVRGLPPRGSTENRVDRSRTGYMIIVAAVRRGLDLGLSRELVRLAGALKSSIWFQREWTKAVARYAQQPEGHSSAVAKLVPPSPYTLSHRSAAHRRRRGAAPTTDSGHNSETTATPGGTRDPEGSAGPIPRIAFGSPTDAEGE